MVDVEKIKQLCKENGTSIKKIEKELGIGNGVIARWSKSNPNYERLSKVANYFNVSVEYLTGTEEKTTPNSGNGLSKEAIEMGRIFDAAAPEIRARIKDVVEGRVAVKTAVNVVDVKCPLDGTDQKIYQNIVKIDDKSFPGSLNNGCEMYHPCQECELCRMAAMFAELRGFGK